MNGASPVLPAPKYIDLLYPDGTHSGIRFDARRGLLEVQKRGIKHVFDLAVIVDPGERLCYTDDQITDGEHQGVPAHECRRRS